MACHATQASHASEALVKGVALAKVKIVVMVMVMVMDMVMVKKAAAERFIPGAAVTVIPEHRWVGHCVTRFTRIRSATAHHGSGKQRRQPGRNHARHDAPPAKQNMPA
jgi:hypothetical protein